MLRIVSLIASATEIVHALGLGGYQVGRSHECDYPPEVVGLPACTRPAFIISGDSASIDKEVKATLASGLFLYEVFPGILEQLQPTHILTQIQCDVCAVNQATVERALGASLASSTQLIALQPDSLEGIFDDIRRVANACGVPDAGSKLVAELRGEMAEIAVRAATAVDRPRVACLEWLEPLMPAGNWMPELVKMAYGDNLFGSAGQHSPYMEWSSLVAADPDILICMPCGWDLNRASAEMHWLTDRPEWRGLRAVRKGRVYVCDGNQYLTRPGPRIVDSLRILAEVIHPDLFPPTLRDRGWRKV